jgi:hypothetical protein
MTSGGADTTRSGRDQSVTACVCEYGQAVRGCLDVIIDYEGVGARSRGFHTIREGPICHSLCVCRGSAVNTYIYCTVHRVRQEKDAHAMFLQGHKEKRFTELQGRTVCVCLLLQSLTCVSSGSALGEWAGATGMQASVFRRWWIAVQAGLKKSVGHTDNNRMRARKNSGSDIVWQLILVH